MGPHVFYAKGLDSDAAKVNFAGNFMIIQTMDSAVYTYTSFLTSPRCNAQSELSVASLAADIIGAATEHADAIGIGYSALIPSGTAWVLSRLVIDMMRYPKMHETYAIDTWIECFNRGFSDRNFRIRSVDTGEILGYVRSVWTVIDIRARRLADLSRFAAIVPLAVDVECPIAKPARIPLADGDDIHLNEYVFGVSDIDFNRHVNTVRYIELIVNTRRLEVYDNCIIRRLELSFRHEAIYGQKALIATSPDGLCTIRDAEPPHTPFVVARMELAGRS